MATSDLRNQHRAKRGFQTGLTMINGAMETEAAPEPAGLPSGASQTLKVGGRQLSDQNNPSLPGGGGRWPIGIPSLAPTTRAHAPQGGTAALARPREVKSHIPAPK